MPPSWVARGELLDVEALRRQAEINEKPGVVQGVQSTPSVLSTEFENWLEVVLVHVDMLLVSTTYVEVDRPEILGGGLDR